jgi:hypothetical protein
VEPELRLLHPDSTLSETTLGFWRTKSIDEIVRSLSPGSEEPLTVKADGTVMQGNHRIKVLQELGYDVDSLPRVPHRGDVESSPPTGSQR